MWSAILRVADGVWEYPLTKDVLRECGLTPIRKCIEARRAHIAAWVVDRPLFEMCMEGERRRGSSRHLFWWEQQLELDEEEDGGSDSEDGDDDAAP